MMRLRTDRPYRGGFWRQWAGRVAIGVVVSVPAAGGVMAETLTDALVQAYTTNPELLAARASLRSVDEGVPQALAGWRPTVSFSASVTEQHISINNSADSTGLTNAQSLTITQNVYDGGSTVAATRSAEATVLAQRASLASTEQVVLFDVVTSYSNVVRDAAVVELNINNERRLERQLEAARDRFAVGEITRTDVAQAESRLARAKAERRQAEGDLASSKATYQRAVGRPPGQLQPAPRVDGLPATVDEVIEFAKKQNPSVLASVYSERAEQADVRTLEAALLPSVDLQGQWSRNDGVQSSSSSSSLNQGVAVTATLTVPLYQAGSVTSQIREQKEIASQARLSISQTQREAVESATQAWEALQSARALIVSLNEEVAAQRIALDGVQQEATVGSRTVLDVLDAEQELLNAQVDLVRQERDEVVTEFQVLAAMGFLTAEGLGLPVQRYDVEANYKRVRNKWWGLE